MKEEFLHYIWKYRLTAPNTLCTTKGDAIKVIHPGTHNTDAGPDFFNAKIEIGDTQWVGNVEIHINSSDWYKHKHEQDKAYDNIILHLVHKEDTATDAIVRSSGEVIPLALLTYNQKLLDNYNALNNKENNIPCSKWIKELDSFTINNWLNTVLIERMEEKTSTILELLKQNKGSWEETYYQHLARCFGLSINTLPFEMLAKSLPLIYLGKHKSSLLQIEALLFGQAGMLTTTDIEDEYFLKLKKEYQFLSNKFNLKAGESHLWKFLRLRPANFPTIRIAQFAQLIHRSSALFSQIIDLATNKKGDAIVKEVAQLFGLSTSEYWETHYTFGKLSKKRTKKTGASFTNTLIINNIVPFVFARGYHYDNGELKNSSLDLLEQLPSEKNAIVNNWKDTGIEANSAYKTQALIHLHKNYCSKGRCLSCRIGNKVVGMV